MILNIYLSNIKKKIYEFKTQLIGKIQVINLLMAVAAAIKSKLSIKSIIKKLKYIKPELGRLEKIGKTKNNSLIILDYAHTPEALKTCLKNIKDQYPLRRIKLVFGCGGDRDKEKRPIMGKIANKFCDYIYLTDDNPRNENPKEIRRNIKKQISSNKFIEVPSRSLAIKKAILNVDSDEVLIVSGKGHETVQEFKQKKYFSDRDHIIKNIKLKNKILSNDWKLNILREFIKNRKLNKLSKFKLSLNSREKNNKKIFFGIRGKYFDGGDYAEQALKNGASVAIVQKIKKNYKKKIKVRNTLKLITELSKRIRISSNACNIAITGSSGKTSLKELLGQCLKNNYKTTYSDQSFNNKFGVPLSLLKLEKNTKFGIFEIGMNRKGEIDYLSKIIKPDIGIITNIGYAHIENFNNLLDIAKAKSELIQNIKRNGTIILNKDDKFFNYFLSLAKKHNLKIISFGKNIKSDVSLSKVNKFKNFSILSIKVESKIYKYKIKNNLIPYTYNILSSVAVLKSLYLINKIKTNFFFKYEIPEGRGNKYKVKIGKKLINIIDESYNSNPSSLRFSIDKFDSLKVDYNKKYLLLSDMLELGKYSKKLHLEVAKDINKVKFKKLYVFGKNIQHTFNKIRTQKKGSILKSSDEIRNFFKNNLNDKDFLMIKGSNSTGLNQIIKQIRKNI